MFPGSYSNQRLVWKLCFSGWFVSFKIRSGWFLIVASVFLYPSWWPSRHGEQYCRAGRGLATNQHFPRTRTEPRRIILGSGFWRLRSGALGKEMSLWWSIKAILGGRSCMVTAKLGLGLGQGLCAAPASEVKALAPVHGFKEWLLGIRAEMRAEGRDKEQTQAGALWGLPQDNVLSPLSGAC